MKSQIFIQIRCQVRQIYDADEKKKTIVTDIKLLTVSS